MALNGYSRIYSEFPSFDWIDWDEDKYEIFLIKKTTEFKFHQTLSHVNLLEINPSIIKIQIPFSLIYGKRDWNVLDKAQKSTFYGL